MILNKLFARVCLVVVLVGSLAISVPAEAATESKTIELYTLEDFSHLTKMGLSRGHNQDVQPLGIILRKGDVLTIQQTNWNFRDYLTLRLYADNEWKEDEELIPPGGTLTYVAKQTVVPLVKTPVSKVKPKITVKYDGDTVLKLPTFSMGTKEESFFSQWDETDAPFAFISWPRINFLVPKANKQSLRKMKDFKSIPEMMRYYQDAIEFFDMMVGLGTNIPNVEARYLVKANANGGGYMYYGSDHIAENAPTINGYLQKGWGPIHEIGHGYQGHFVNQQNGDDMLLGDVWNNIFAHNYEMKIGVDSTWMYGKDYKAFEERQWQNRLTKKKYNEMDYNEKLYFFVSLTERFGVELISEFYNEYYKFVKSGGDIKTPTNDLLVKYFSKAANANLAPYFKSYGVLISYELEQELPGKYPLGNAFHAREVLTLSTIQRYTKDLGLKRTDSVLTNYDLKSAGINQDGDGVLQFDQTEPSEFEGIVGKLFDPISNELIKEAVVKEGVATFSNVPVGNYYALLPKSNSESMYPSIQYLDVTANSLNNDQNRSKVALDVNFEFKGLGDAVFASMKIADKLAVITTVVAAPHVYFKKEHGPYASIMIKSAKGDVKYTRDYIGDVWNKNGVDRVNLETGDTITIRHKEPNRLVPLKGGVVSELVATEPQVTYVYTSEGLYIQSNNGAVVKDASIVEYFDYDKVNVDFILKGLGDDVFATVRIKGNNAVISTRGNAPHTYFRREHGPYASVEISNNSGGGKYYREYIGNVNTAQATETVPLEEGDRITIRHKEPGTRLVPIGAKLINDFITKSQTVTFVYTSKGLMKEGEDPANIQKRTEQEKRYIEKQFGTQPNFNKDGYYWKYK